MTAADFVEAAVRCQRKAEIEGIRGNSRLMRSYLRRVSYACRKAKQLGADASGPVWAASLLFERQVRGSGIGRPC